MACTSLVVSALPPMPQSPLSTSSIVTQVTPRMFSPSIETMASVSFLMICLFWSLLKTSLMTRTWMSGIPILLPSLFCSAKPSGLLCLAPHQRDDHGYSERSRDHGECQQVGHGHSPQPGPDTSGPC